MKKVSTGQEIQRKKDAAAELMEILERVPENRKDRVLGIVEGFVLSAEAEQKGV